MFKLSEFITRMQEAREFLEEKLIVYGGGKKYGQVVFLAGGAGSGKGFATKQFMDGNTFKIRDVDEMKLAFLKLDALTKKFPEIRGLDLRKPDDVFKLHMFVKEKGVKEKTLDLLLTKDKKATLPNIMFDITAKGIGDITDVVPLLLKVGYDPRDIHVTWILTDYKVAMVNNAGRDRVVPEDILLGTHKGAAKTMMGLITQGSIPRSMVDGSIFVVLNNPENTVVWGKEDKVTDSKSSRAAQVKAEKPVVDDDNNIDRRKRLMNRRKGEFKFIVKSFSYLTVKRPGKPIESKAEILDQVASWVKANSPEGWDK